MRSFAWASVKLLEPLAGAAVSLAFDVVAVAGLWLWSVVVAGGATVAFGGFGRFGRLSNGHTRQQARGHTQCENLFHAFLSDKHETTAGYRSGSITNYRVSTGQHVSCQ